MACLESNFFGNTVSHISPQQGVQQNCPRSLIFRATTGILTSHALWSPELYQMLLTALTCIPAPQNTAHFTAPDIPRCPLQPECQARASRQSETVATCSMLPTLQPPSHQCLLIYFTVNYLPDIDRTAFLSPDAYNSSFLSPNHTDSPRGGYPEDYMHKLDWEIQIGRSKAGQESYFRQCST